MPKYTDLHLPDDDPRYVIRLWQLDGRWFAEAYVGGEFVQCFGSEELVDAASRAIDAANSRLGIACARLAKASFARALLKMSVGSD